MQAVSCDRDENIHLKFKDERSKDATNSMDD
jgi:hypothetical protein